MMISKKVLAGIGATLVLCSCSVSYKRPVPLREGDVIGVVSLSSRVDPAADTAEARSRIEALGFRVRYGAHLLDQSDSSFGASDSARAADFTQMAESPDVKAILFYRGGYGTVRTLDYIDWRKFRRNPKWLVGYSDVTMLHLAAGRQRVQSLHGNMPVTFGDDSLSVALLKEALTGDLSTIETLRHPLDQNGTATGRLVGGNLSLLCAASGTPEAQSFRRGKYILFIEDVGEKLYQLDRMLQNLSRSGVLSRCKAIVVGHLTGITALERFGLGSAEELVATYTKRYRIPVIFGFPAGHESPNVPFYLGRKVRVTVTDTTARMDFL